MATGVRMIILRDAAGVATEAEVVVDMAVEVVVGMAAEVEVSAVEEEVTAWEVWGPDFATSTGTLILCRNSKRCDYESFVVLVLFYCCTDNSSSRRCLICNTLYRTYVEGIYRERLTYVDSSISRARSLRNLLVSGNECGRVFPAGVGPGSPSRDAANWLPSRFSLSVETRRRYGWLRMMVFPGARLFPSPNLVPFGRVAARERREHCRGEPGSTLLSGGYAPDSAKAEGSSIVDEPGEG